MNFDQMQRMVLIGSGNMKQNHPLYKWVTGDVATSTPSVINLAANRLVRMKPRSFPELVTDWNIGPTVNNINEYAVPADMVVMYDVARSVAAAGAPPSPNWNTDRTYPVEFVPLRKDFDLMTRDSTVTGPPTLVCKKGKVITVWPTPTTGNLVYLKGYGIMEEASLVNAGDTFFMNPDYHPAVVRLATSLIAELRGSYDRAAALMKNTKDEIGEQGDLVGEERHIAEAMSIMGWPYRG